MKKSRQYHCFTNEELWSLDVTIAKFILPRLKRFKKTTDAHPNSLDENKWDAILDKMIFSFDFIATDKMWKIENMKDEKMWKKVNEGLELFAKWFNSLWL